MSSGNGPKARGLPSSVNSSKPKHHAVRSALKQHTLTGWQTIPQFHGMRSMTLNSSTRIKLPSKYPKPMNKLIAPPSNASIAFSKLLASGNLEGDLRAYPAQRAAETRPLYRANHIKPLPGLFCYALARNLFVRSSSAGGVNRG